MTTSLPVPEGIDDVSMRALVEVINARYDALPIERCLVMHVTSNTISRPYVARGFGLSAPEFQVAETPVAIIQQGLELRRHKGTIWALREVLRRLDWGEIVFVEDGRIKYDGSIKYNGERRYGADGVAGVTIIFFDVVAPLTTEQTQKLWDLVRNWMRASFRDHFRIGLRQAGQHTVMHNTRPT